jgi:hypothetical protein
MLDARALLEKHRSKSVLVDTNLLVLLLVGIVKTRRILEFKRTSGFTIRDFELLASLIATFSRLVATPHMLGQVSDLADLPGGELRQIRQLFRSIVQEQIDESYEPAGQLVNHSTFELLGLTDAGIATVCSQGILVLTADVKLQLALQSRGGDAVNFHHVRAFAPNWNKTGRK